MLRQGDVIFDGDKNEYKILKPIGNGGMGYVLLAERQSDKKKFAVKTLSIFIEGNSHHTALINEAKLTEDIKHQNVISYLYFHSGDTYPELQPYIIMELAEEKTLQDLLDERIQSKNFIEQYELLSIYNRLIDGMEAINRKLVHRDIKPSNILFIDGEIKISDFGIAKIVGDPTRSKSFKGSGTLAFFPPEAFLNQSNTLKMDIYSMGLVFFLLATLKHPYEIRQQPHNEDEWKNAHLSEIPPLVQNINNNLSPKISSIIQKMLEKNPSKRFSEWDEIRTEIRAVDDMSKSPHSLVIEKMVSKNNQKKSEVAQKTAEIEKLRQDEEQKVKIILYQFTNDIIIPIKEFITSFNAANPEKQDQITILNEDYHRDHTLEDYPFTFFGPDLTFFIEINLHIINSNDNLYRDIPDHFGDSYKHTIEPTLDNKPVLAWGAIQERGGKGLNLILCKNNSSTYGDWYILENKHSVLAQRKDSRPDPFPFNLDEIKIEIQSIKAFSKYNTKVITYSSRVLIDFISEF